MWAKSGLFVLHNNIMRPKTQHSSSMTMFMHPLLPCTQRLAELRDNYLQKGTSNCLIGTDSDHIPSEECGTEFKRSSANFWYKACTSLRASVRISNIFLEPSPVHMHARKRVCPCGFVCVCMKEMSIKNFTSHFLRF